MAAGCRAMGRLSYGTASAYRPSGSAAPQPRARPVVWTPVPGGSPAAAARLPSPRAALQRRALLSRPPCRAAAELRRAQQAALDNGGTPAGLPPACARRLGAPPGSQVRPGAPARGAVTSRGPRAGHPAARPGTGRAPCSAAWSAARRPGGTSWRSACRPRRRSAAPGPG